MAAISFEHAGAARAALNAIVSDPAHGPEALSSPQTVSNLLQDLLPDAPRETGLLTAAASAGVPAALREHVAQGMSVEVAIGIAASSLAAKAAFTPAACTWVVSELAVALGLADPDIVVAAAEPDANDAEEVPRPGAHPAEVAVAGVTSATDVSPWDARSALPVPPAAPTTPIGAPLVPVRRRRLAPAAVVAASIVVAVAVVAAVIFIGTGPGTNKAHYGGSAQGGQSHGGSTPSGPATSGGSVQPSSSGSGSPSPSAAAAVYRVVSTLNPGVAGSITQVAWTPDSSVVATSDKNGSTYLWNPATGQPQGAPLTVPGAGKVYSMAISPDGRTLATGCSNGSTYLWDIASGQRTATLRDPGPAAGKQVDSVVFSPDGKTLVSADGDGYANVWRISATYQRLTPVMRLADPAGSGVWSVTFSPNGTLATGDYSGNIYLWNLGTGSHQGPLTIPGGIAVTALAFSPDGGILAAGSGSASAGTGSVYLFNPVSAAGQLVASPGPVWAFSFDGSTLAAADGNGQSYLWDVTASGLTATSAGSLPDPNSGSEGVGALALSPDGKWLVTGDTNGRAYVWTSG